jgi:hypothetical protein
MVLSDGSYERLRAVTRCDEIAYVEACRRLYFAGLEAGAGWATTSADISRRIFERLGGR